MRMLLAGSAGLFASVVAALALSPGVAPFTFGSYTQAQDHCPRDTVVWLNPSTGIYHYRNQRWYGKTADGAFVCRNEANQAGNRAAKNGQ